MSAHTLDVTEAPATGARTGFRLTASALTPLTGAAGLALIGLSYNLHRTGRGGSADDVLFWAGFVLIVLPVALQLLRVELTRSERLALVVYSGLATYAIKVLHDPAAFTFSDEFTHLTTAEALRDHQALFHAGPLIGGTVQSNYPGLHSITVALSDITTLSLFVSGLIVIGIARTLLLGALFLLFEAVSGSARLAGLGALLYMGSANYLFFTGQFSYESLSLPLFALIFAVAIRIRDNERRQKIALTACTVLLIGATVTTHHLTAYALAACFIVLAVMGRARAVWAPTRAVGLGLFTLLAALAWSVFAAPDTGPYLHYIARRTVNALSQSQNGTAHRPFQSSGPPTPMLERAIALVALLIVVVAVLYALRRLWKEREPVNAPGALLIAAAVGFLVLFPLKIFPGAWETANRSSDFLFIGVAFMLSAVITHRNPGPRARAAIAGLITIAICGAFIQGWPSVVRLGQSLQTKANGATLDAPGLQAARWAIGNLPPGATYLADEASGRQLAALGAKTVYAGRAIQSPDLFSSATLPSWQRDRLADAHIQFVLLDRRKVSSDNLAGYFLQPRSNPSGGYGYYRPGVRAKYMRLPRSRMLYDNGDIAIFDVRGLYDGLAQCDAVGVRDPSRAFACEDGSRAVYYAGPDRSVQTPQVRVAVSRVREERRARPKQLRVVVGLELRNQAGAPLRPDPAFDNFTLKVGGKQLRRARTSDVNDNLRATTTVPARTAIERSLTFVLRGADATRYARDGGTVTVQLPARGAGTHDETLAIRIAPGVGG